jgi:hypothetical protein
VETITWGVLVGGLLLLVFTAACAPVASDAEAKPPADIVVDNADPGFQFVLSKGRWNKSTRDPGFEGDGYLWCKPRRKNLGKDIVRWCFRVPRDGRYRVSAKWVASKPTDRATDAPYTVLHREGQALVRVNMADLKLAAKWYELGTFDFLAGQDYRVLLSSYANNTVVADAIKVSWAGPPSPVAKPSAKFVEECAKKGKVIFADDFSGGLGGWTFEGAAETKIREGKLYVKPLYSPGQMAFLRTPAPAAFRLEFDVRPISPSGFWLVFFCCTSPGRDNLFDPGLKPREAFFDHYVANKEFQSYHISYRRNQSPTCNLRKNPGLVMLKQEKLDGVLPAGKTYHVALTYGSGRIKLTVDGKTYVEHRDEKGEAHGAGHICLRNLYQCETEYDNVVLYDLTDER